MKVFYRLMLVAVFAVGAPVLQAATTNVLLAITSPWRFNTNSMDTIPTWKATSYNDSAWPGPSNALLFIETAALPAPKNTSLPEKSGGGPMNTYYFRTTFNLANAAGVTSLMFSNLVDDGAVYYLNGVEVQRLYLAAGAVTYATTAMSHEADTWSNFTLAGALLTNLLEGVNTLAAEVHQVNSASSDIVFGSAVSAVYGYSTNLTRGPYLQCSTTNSIVIRWRTDYATDSRVDYGGSPDALNQSVTLPTLTNEHIVTLTNLDVDTKYFYAVGMTDRLLSPVSSDQFFLTHPLPGTTKSLRVWVIGDAGTKNASQAAVRDAFYAFNGTNTVHAWLQLGDNAYDTGTDAEYQAAVFDMYAPLLRRSVTWPALGNHETAQSQTYVDTYPYFSLFTLPTAGEAGGVPSGTEHYYSFDLGMVHFVCLDSMTADRSTNGAMAIWLRSDLAVNTNRWLIAFWHHPPYSRGSHDSDVGGPGYDTQMGQMRTNFLPILEKAGVDLVFCGHSHCYERSKLLNGHYGLSSSFNASSHVVQSDSGRETNGVGAYRKPDGLGETPVPNCGAIYTVAGSSGQATTGTTNHPAMFYSALSLGSVVLDFHSNRLDAVFLRETGAIDDSFTIIKDGTHPPLLTQPAFQSGSNFQFTVLCRGYRTNLIETTTNLAQPGAWQTVGINTTTNSSFNFIHTNALTNFAQFYRVRRP
jgi:hypothetical protein